MSSQHLSVGVHLYPDGRWSLTLLQTTCEPGKPARCEQLVCRRMELQHVLEEVRHAVHALVLEESERARNEGRRAGEHPNVSARRAQS